jgi:hypothetical protein
VSSNLIPSASSAPKAVVIDDFHTHRAADADDGAVHDARKGAWAAGGVTLAPEVSAAILRGDSRLKAIRHWRSETQWPVTVKTGVGPG